MGTHVVYEITKNGVKTTRYRQGWNEPEQDRKPSPRVARIVSQDYEVIKRECLAQGALWEDPSFPATLESVGRIEHINKIHSWCRPGDLCKGKDPHMFVQGFESSDVEQGALGDCWFLAATACLCCVKNKSSMKELFHEVVPQDNSFSKDYAGVFHFGFWQYGKRVNVVVDDRLPTDANGQLVFAHSTTDNEFWLALLEKAYAKLNGSYAALVGGTANEAMQDFTGGITETIEFNFKDGVPKDLYTIIKKAFDSDALMSCSVEAQGSYSLRGAKLSNGLVESHAYSITSIKEIQVRGSNFKLVRVRNPWAKTEWNGAWSDGSPECSALSQADKDSLGMVIEDDGEFWMSFDDFVKNFSRTDMCMMVSSFDALKSNTGRKIQWRMTSYEGSWKKNVTAGGCAMFKETFLINPQYIVEVLHADEGGDDNNGTLIVALMQKDSRQKFIELGRHKLSIGYGIYKIPDGQAGRMDKESFSRYERVGGTETFINNREMVGRHKLSPGRYLIVPSTYNPGEEEDFMLRIFSEKPSPLSEADVDTQFIDRPDLETVETSNDGDQESVLKELFRQTAGEDQQIDAYELKFILESLLKAEFKLDGVSLETARSMVATMDRNHSGKLGYDEFKFLWNDLIRWLEIFLQSDVSKTNSLSSTDMRAALRLAGFTVGNHTFQCLVMRYSDQKGDIKLDDFLLCVVRLKTMFETFQHWLEKSVPITLDQIIQTTMYA